MPQKKERKILASEEVLKDMQKFLDEEDNESINDEDVSLDQLYDEKGTFVSFYQYMASNCQLIFAFISLHVFWRYYVLPPIFISANHFLK